MSAGIGIEAEADADAPPQILRDVENRRATLRLLAQDMKEYQARIADCLAAHDAIAAGAQDPQTRAAVSDARRAEVFAAQEAEYNEIVARRPPIPPDNDDDDG